MRRIILMVVCVVGLLGGRARAGDAGVGETVVADKAAVSAGGEFEVAITLEVPEGKHVYWKNPGDAGMATKFTFTPSAGVSVGEVEYPVPMKFLSPGDITDYGYVGKVTFLAHVMVGKDAKEVAIGVKGSWLCCDDHGCTPGDGEMSLSLPLGANGAEANGEVFAKAKAVMPPEAIPPELVRDYGIGGFVLAGESESFRGDIGWKTKVTDVDVYPTAVDGLDISDIKVNTDGLKTTLSFSGRVLKGQKLVVETLPLLVVYTDDTGKRRGAYWNADLKMLAKGSGK